MPDKHTPCAHRGPPLPVTNSRLVPPRWPAPCRRPGGAMTGSPRSAQDWPAIAYRVAVELLGEPNTRPFQWPRMAMGQARQFRTPSRDRTLVRL